MDRSYFFSELPALQKFHREHEEYLARAGWELVDFFPDRRRSGPDRRQTSRAEAADRRHSPRSRGGANRM
jgi:hypothetical protein